MSQDSGSQHPGSQHPAGGSGGSDDRGPDSRTRIRGLKTRLGGLESRAEILDPTTDQLRIQELLTAGATFVDTFEGQFAELLRTRDPTMTKAQAREALRDVTPPASVFVHYPWRHALIRILAEEEFVELRTSRNRHKISAAEQRRLRESTLAVAGLSVGASSALTLAQEGLGGTFHLADFDELELTNLNRLRATLLDLGLPKTVITARAIAEIDPYVETVLFPAGVQEENLESFLDGVDLLFEECDDLAMKLRLREAARDRGVPVLMETSDRGMLDVERFDHEPDRPILHGLIGAMRSDDLVGLTTYEKVPTVLRIIGAETMSTRMAASLVDIDTEVATWPQLASAIALGGALNTEAARRILLGLPMASGRFYVDLGKMLRGHGHVAQPPSDPPIEVAGGPPDVRLVPRREGDVLDDAIPTLVEFATLAPSGGNAQPWDFHWDGAVLRACVHPERGNNLLDHRRSASWLAIGAAVRHLEVAARAIGWAAEVEREADASESTVATLRFQPSAPDPEAMEVAHALARRCTDRRRGRREPFDLAEELRARIAPLACVLVEGPILEAAAWLLGDADRFRFLSERLCRELLDEVRWTAEEARRRRDGLDLASLEMTPTDVAGMRLIRRADVRASMRELCTGAGLGKVTRESVQSASALLLLRAEGNTKADFVEGGARVVDAWTMLTERGWSVQPMTALPYLLARLRDGGVGLTRWEREALVGLRDRYEAIFGAPGQGGQGGEGGEGGEGADLILFRVARRAESGPPARSLRLGLEDVLTASGAAARGS